MPVSVTCIFVLGKANMVLDFRLDDLQTTHRRAHEESDHNLTRYAAAKLCQPYRFRSDLARGI
jgi:hypothetical protein